MVRFRPPRIKVALIPIDEHIAAENIDPTI
jgi:hypothetical protein